MGNELRRLRFGLLTLLGIRQRGFFIPHRYADHVPTREMRGPYEAIERIFKTDEPVFSAFLERLDHYAVALATIEGTPPEPRWDQDWFPRLDAAAAYVLVRESRPRRIVEIGSGHSTRFMARAARDSGLAVEITAIDPAPRATLDPLPVTLIRAPLQEAGVAPFEPLAAGDVLFIDSSHVLMPGTDVDILLNRILPALPPGVLVHIHDVFLPDDYPPDWEWRGYNEQLAIATLLQGGAYRLLWASHYVSSRMPESVAASAASRLELKPGARESSLWLVKQ
jgi:predicted O-methyltransferase YrrM